MIRKKPVPGLDPGMETGFPKRSCSISQALSTKEHGCYRARSGRRAMKFPRRTFLSLAGALALAPAISLGASALDYPTRPITVIVPFPAGGPVDTLARLLSEPMRIALGQPLVVENVGGAGGSIAVARGARAEPHGSTTILGDCARRLVPP